MPRKQNGKRRKRVDDEGRAFAGSRLQTQIYVNRRTSELNAAVGAKLGLPPGAEERFRWVSPSEQDGFREYYDRAFLDKLGLLPLATKLDEFWPSGGPHWDALGVVDPDNADPTPRYLLVESKSYAREVFGGGCLAKESRVKIDDALRATSDWLNATCTPSWTGRLYQYANRLAHLYFLRELGEREAWLINLCFVDDPHRPTSVAEWHTALPRFGLELGLTHRSPWVADVLLPALPRSELVATDE
jgi:hypothetical protein